MGFTPHYRLERSSLPLCFRVQSLYVLLLFLLLGGVGGLAFEEWFWAVFACFDVWCGGVSLFSFPLFDL